MIIYVSAADTELLDGWGMQYWISTDIRGIYKI